MATRSEVAFRSADTGFRVVLRWPDNRLTRSRLGDLVRPTVDDFRATPLPTSMWPLYFVLHVGRIAMSRGGHAATQNLGPILDTPPALVPKLLDFAGVESDDVLIDLGSGDGRIVIGAAQAKGSRCIGHEIDARLVEKSRGLATAAGVGDRVTIVHGDASTAALLDASVVFVFLPADISRNLIPDALGRMQSGARLIAHEQERLEVDSHPPTKCEPLISDDGITVAHLWIA